MQPITLIGAFHWAPTYNVIFSVLTREWPRDQARPSTSRQRFASASRLTRLAELADATFVYIRGISLGELVGTFGLAWIIFCSQIEKLGPHMWRLLFFSQSHLLAHVASAIVSFKENKRESFAQVASISFVEGTLFLQLWICLLQKFFQSCLENWKNAENS